MDPVEEIRKLLFETRNKSSNKKEISLKLSSILLEDKNGILNLIKATIDPDESSQKVTTHNQRFQAVSTIVAHMPCLPVSNDIYYEKLSHQLFTIIKLTIKRGNERTDEVGDKLWRSAAFIMIALYQKNSQLGLKYLIKPIMNTLQTVGNNELTISDCILIIYRLIVCTFPLKIFYDYFSNLLFLRIKLERTQSHCKLLLNDILIQFLSKNERTIYLLENALFNCLSYYHFYNIIMREDTEENLLCMYVDINVNSIDEKAIEEKDEEEDSLKDLEMIDDIVQIVNSLIEKTSQTFQIDFFLLLLERLNFTSKNVNKMLLYSLIDALQESVSKSILLYPSKAVQLLASTLSRAANTTVIPSSTTSSSASVLNIKNVNTDDFLGNSTDRINNVYLSEAEKSSLNDLRLSSLNMCLEIINQIVNSNKKFNYDDINHLKQCQTYLKQLIDDKNDLKGYDEIRSIAQQLFSKIERLSDESLLTADLGDNCGDYEYIEAIKHLNDDCMPMKAHGLVALRRLILSKDKKTMNEKNQLLLLLQGCLSDKETYIYLAAIKTLSALAIVCTDDILPVLTNAFRDNHRSVQERMNVAEVLIELSKNLGEMAFHYSKEYVNMFLVSCRDSEETIRISSLSNLGQFCSILRFGLTSYIVEIFHCVTCLLESDPSLEVKRAALMFIHLLLCGIDKYSVKVIEKELVSICKLIKRIRATSLDDILQLHCQLAIDQINRLVKEILFDQQNTIKRIQML